MSDISGEISDGTYADETAAKDAAVQSEEVKSEEVKSEEVKSEEVKSEEVKSEDVQSEDVQSEDVLTEEVLTEEVLTEEVLSEDVLSEDVLSADSEIAEGQSELPSKLVVRRVRTSPVEVIPRAPRDRGLLYSLLDTARFISLGLVIGILLVVFVVQRNDVYGPSMEPNLHEKDAVFVEMISKYFAAPERGNIMTVNATGIPGYSKSEKIIKRVIGLPGETVTIKDGYVYINGVLLDEPYLADNVPTYINDSGVTNGYDNITLGENEYYFMGDNRGASLDSRVLGPIPISRIKAHVIAKIYPFDDIGLL